MGLLAAPLVISMAFGDAGLFTTARIGGLAGRELVTGELTAVRTRQAAENAGRLMLRWKIAAIAKSKTLQHAAVRKQPMLLDKFRNSVAGHNRPTLFEKVRHNVAAHNLRRVPLPWHHAANGPPS
ncbi:MAG TPA: hypothetical protein VFE47_23515 [Tepidisphaeraceae bacterium]|jgi:hypothetical protein|nr:hypothetical protein [Tepidisphaeraceae bacterium]